MIRLPIAVLLLAVAAAAPAKLYKWVDEDGNVTYSERKPPDVEAEEVRLRGVQSISNEKARERLEALNEQAETLRKDREFKANYASENAEREERLKQNCETARHNKRILETASRIKADDGSYLDDAAREARMQSTLQAIKDNCGG